MGILVIDVGTSGLRAAVVRPDATIAFEVLVATKAALDPQGILNPGKLGLPSPFGPSGY